MQTLNSRLADLDTTIRVMSENIDALGNAEATRLGELVLQRNAILELLRDDDGIALDGDAIGFVLAA